MAKKETDSYDRIIKYTGLFGGVQGIVVLINIVRTKLVSMLLGPTGFGITESFNRTLNLVKSIVFAFLWISGIFFDIDNLENQTIAAILKLNPIAYLVKGFRESFMSEAWFWEHPVVSYLRQSSAHQF